MISAVHNFRVTKPRMMRMGGACSTRGTDEKCTDHVREKTDQNEPERTQGVKFAVRESGSR